MTLGENFVILNMKRDSDGEEGHAHVRVRDLFKTRERILLGLVFTNSKLLGLTLNEVNDFETSITPENIHTL